MIRGDLVCELVSLSPELLWMGDEPSAGKRHSRRCLEAFKLDQGFTKLEQNKVCGLSRPPILLFNCLNASCFLTPVCFGKKNIHKNLSCLCFFFTCPFCVTVGFLGFIHLFLFFWHCLLHVAWLLLIQDTLPASRQVNSK